MAGETLPAEVEAIILHCCLKYDETGLEYDHAEMARDVVRRVLDLSATAGRPELFDRAVAVTLALEAAPRFERDTVEVTGSLLGDLVGLLGALLLASRLPALPRDVPPRPDSDLDQAVNRCDYGAVHAAIEAARREGYGRGYDSGSRGAKDIERGRLRDEYEEHLRAVRSRREGFLHELSRNSAEDAILCGLLGKLGEREEKG